MKTKPNIIKAIILIVSALLLVGAIGATVAYVSDKTPSLENEFTPVTVACEILENFDGASKTDVAVKNTGSAKAYVRAVVVVNWVSEEDGSIYSAMPKLDTDYTLILGTASWKKSSDGYYYYTYPVAPGQSTELLISSITPTATVPSGYKLSVTIAATALQSDPKEPVEKLWNVNVLDNGNLYIK